MAGNPCYLLTITSDIKKNDIILGKADSVNEPSSDKHTSKLKASSGNNVHHMANN